MTRVSEYEDGVTAIIPTFNRAGLIARAIESVLQQSVSADQIVVVDDGSTDDTEAVCRRYSTQIQYFRQANGGASASRNTGAQLARHKWVAYLDSDDYWVTDHLERLTDAIRVTQERASVYFADMQMPASDGGGTLWEMIGFQPQRPVHLVQDGAAWMLMNRQPMMLQTSLISKAALERVGGLDVRFRLVHDTHLFALLAIGGAVCAVSGVGCVQTSDDASETRLTEAIPLGSYRKRTEDIAMWRDLLSRGIVPDEYRPLVRYNIADCYWSDGRTLIKAGQYGRGLARLTNAMMVDSRVFTWIVRHGELRGYETTVRPHCGELASSGLAVDRPLDRVGETLRS